MIEKGFITVEQNYVRYFDSPYAYKIFIEDNKEVNIISVFPLKSTIVLTYSKRERVKL